jgi:uncharacterized membrane protein
MKIQVILPFVLVGLMSFQCNKHHKFCTQEFVTHGTALVNPLGEQVAYESYAVIHESTGDTVITEKSYPFEAEYFNQIIVLTDNELYYTTSSATKFLLHVVIDSLNQVSGKFVFNNDGCHVRKLGGPEQMVVD